MGDHTQPNPGPHDTTHEAAHNVGKRGSPRQPRVLLSEEPPVLTPAAAAVLLRILIRASDRVHGQDRLAVEEERWAA